MNVETKYLTRVIKPFSLNPPWCNGFLARSETCMGCRDGVTRHAFVYVGRIAD